MLCRAGHITKNEIGAIRIQQTETFVELTRESVEKFLEAVGPGGKVDKGVILTRLDGIPDVAKGGGGGGGGKKTFGKKKPYSADKSGGRGDFKPKGRFVKEQRDTGGDDKPRDKPWQKSKDKPRDKPREKTWEKSKDKPRENTWEKPKDKPKEKTWDKPKDKPKGKTWDKAAKKPTGKKPYQSHFDKDGAASGGAANPGSSPLKRKKKSKKPAFK